MTYHYSIQTLQWHGRYEREFNQGKRPIVKVILEQDLPATRPMVLCLSSIIYNGDGKVMQQAVSEEEREQQQLAIKGAGTQAQVQLTDGWYGVKAVLDQALTRLLQAGNLKLGMYVALHILRCS